MINLKGELKHVRTSFSSKFVLTNYLTQKLKLICEETTLVF